MVSAEHRREVARKFPDLRIPDIGVKDLFEHSQLLGPYELLVVQEPAVPDDRVPDHVLDLVDDLRPNAVLHWNITSRSSTGNGVYKASGCQRE